MNKKLFSVLAAAALIASAFTIVPAKAATEVPGEPNISDPQGDGNYINGQGQSALDPVGRDHTGPENVSNVGDILGVWFTHDAESIHTHFHTFRPGPSTQSILFRVQYDPGAGATCAWIQGRSDGLGNPDLANHVSLRIVAPCGEAQTIVPEEGAGMEWEEGPEGTGILTITMPRSAHESFQDGKALRTPYAETRHFIGAATAPMIDDTDPEAGSDYEITSGGGSKPPAAQPPGKNNPPGQGNQKCSKIKNKKKRQQCKKNNKKKNKKPKGCSAYKAGELGAEAETIKLNESATEEAPHEQTVELDMSTANWTPTDPSTTYFNVQIDTKKNEDVGLWVLFEFPTRRDYDLALFYPDGSYGAQASGFNTASETGLFSPGHGGENGPDYEKLLGIRTSRCGGWTVEAKNYQGEGGEFAIKLWLGDIETDPLAQGEETP